MLTHGTHCKESLIVLFLSVLLQEMIKPTFTSTNSTTTQSSASSSPSSSSVSMHTQSGTLSLSSSTCWPVAAGMNAQSVSSANGTVLKSSPAGVMQLPSGFTLMPGGASGHLFIRLLHVVFLTFTD